MRSASPLVMMLLMFAVFYFILIRPQAKKQKQHQALLQALKVGDNVITRGGMIGTISGIKDTELVLELQERVRVRVLRSYVEGTYEPTTSTITATASSDKAA